MTQKAHPTKLKPQWELFIEIHSLQSYVLMPPIKFGFITFCHIIRLFFLACVALFTRRSHASNLMMCACVNFPVLASTALATSFYTSFVFRFECLQWLKLILMHSHSTCRFILYHGTFFALKRNEITRERKREKDFVSIIDLFVLVFYWFFVLITKLYGCRSIGKTVK